MYKIKEYKDFIRENTAAFHLLLSWMYFNVSISSKGLLGGVSDQQINDPSSAAAAASSTVNAGGQTPIEIGSSTPVDMGLFNGAASIQKGIESNYLINTGWAKEKVKVIFAWVYSQVIIYQCLN